MIPSQFVNARRQLALVAACLLLADYLPIWRKLWFVAESGHFGGGSFLTVLLLLGLYRRWRPALGLTYAFVGLQLVLAGFIIYCNSTMGGPLLGFLLISALHLGALAILSCATDLNQYLKSRAAARFL